MNSGELDDNENLVHFLGSRQKGEKETCDFLDICMLPRMFWDSLMYDHTQNVVRKFWDFSHILACVILT